jgi:hypothetical protein
MENEYIRIGTVYYKNVRKPLTNGSTCDFMVPWSVECIRQDHGKSFLATIKRYDGFCFVPAHLDYQRDIGNFYNRYQPFEHIPAPGNCCRTLLFLNHVFGEQLDLGLDYLKILLFYPVQVLPILSLVSRERNTGKTTFLNFMKAIFGDNMTINSNEDFRSNFNAEWAHKLIIAVDETLLDRKEDSERIKALSTSRYYKVEAKGVDRQEIEFFGKFILCSNNEDNFINIDPAEIRFWVRKLPVLVNDNKNLLQELKKEIPAFLQYLIERPFSTQPATRMWFRAEQLSTAALKRVKRYNKSKLETEMALVLLTILDSREEEEGISFCLADMQAWLQKKGFRNYDSNSIKSVLQDGWKLKPVSNSLTYLQYRLGGDGNIYESQQKGRFYTMTKKRVLDLNNFDELDENSITY